MAQSTNPFFDFDFARVMSACRLPGVDVDGWLANQRKTFEAVAEAQRLFAEGVNSALRRQAEIVRRNAEEALAATREVVEARSFEDRTEKQAAYAKNAYGRAVAEGRELADLVAESNRAAFDVINRRVAESVDEWTKLVSTPARKRA